MHERVSWLDSRLSAAHRISGTLCDGDAVLLDQHDLRDKVADPGDENVAGVACAFAFARSLKLCDTCGR
jgi:hypothetical protein